MTDHKNVHADGRRGGPSAEARSARRFAARDRRQSSSSYKLSRYCSWILLLLLLPLRSTIFLLQHTADILRRRNRILPSRFAPTPPCFCPLFQRTQLAYSFMHMSASPVYKYSLGSSRSADDRTSVHTDHKPLCPRTISIPFPEPPSFPLSLPAFLLSPLGLSTLASYYHNDERTCRSLSFPPLSSGSPANPSRSQTRDTISPCTMTKNQKRSASITALATLYPSCLAPPSTNC
jgi:hypothetical protein